MMNILEKWYDRGEEVVTNSMSWTARDFISRERKKQQTKMWDSRRLKPTLEPQ